MRWNRTLTSIARNAAYASIAWAPEIGWRGGIEGSVLSRVYVNDANSDAAAGYAVASANVGYLAALGTEGVARSDRVAAEAVGAIVGPGAAKLIAAAILVSIFSAMNGITISAPRVYYAMARDGLFFSKLADVHPRYGTPAISIIAGTIWAMVLAASGTFEQLLTYVVFVGWIFYALGAACVFVLRRTQPDAERPFRVPGYPWTPLLFIVAAVALVLNTIATQPGRAAIGIGVVLLGLPVYFFWRRGT